MQDLDLPPGRSRICVSTLNCVIAQCRTLYNTTSAFQKQLTSRRLQYKARDGSVSECSDHVDVLTSCLSKEGLQHRRRRRRFLHELPSAKKMDVNAGNSARRALAVMSDEVVLNLHIAPGEFVLSAVGINKFALLHDDNALPNGVVLGVYCSHRQRH